MWLHACTDGGLLRLCMRRWFFSGTYRFSDFAIGNGCIYYIGVLSFRCSLSGLLFSLFEGNNIDLLALGG